MTLIKQCKILTLISHQISSYNPQLVGVIFQLKEFLNGAVPPGSLLTVICMIVCKYMQQRSNFAL